MTKQNCPNCGAIISEEKCPYCGTMFYDFSAIELDKPCFVKFRFGDKIMRVQVKLNNLNYQESPDDVSFYADNKRLLTLHRSTYRELNLSFLVLPHSNEVLDRDDVVSEIVDLNEVTSDTKGW